MRVAIIHRGEHSTREKDIRVKKLVRSLQSATYQVMVICGNRFQLPRLGWDEGATIYRLRSFPVRFIARLFHYPSVLPNPMWLCHVVQSARRSGADVLIARDLPMAVPVVLAGRLMGIPTILDMAENWPEAMRVWNAPKWVKLADNVLVARLIERKVVPLFDHILVVTEEQRDRLVYQLGIYDQNISIVRNTIDLDSIPTCTRQGVQVLTREPAIVYIGAIDAHRGLDTCIHAMPCILNSYPSVHLYIVGRESPYTTVLAKEARRLGVSDSISFSGWVPLSTIMSDLKQINAICIVPQDKNLHTDTTIPNKLFDYMAAGKPVIVSDARPLKRLVETERCGLVFQSGKPEDFVACVVRLLEDSEFSNRLGCNGKQAVMREYNWAVDSKRLLEVVASILSRD